jgi:hypothetical protein
LFGFRLALCVPEELHGLRPEARRDVSSAYEKPLMAATSFSCDYSTQPVVGSKKQV